MLDPSPANLLKEVEAAIRVQKLHTGQSARLIKRYAGKSYRDDWQGDDSGDNCESYEFEYQVNMVPNLIHTNPAVEVKGLMPGIDDMQKEALDAAYPQWLEQVNFAERMQPIAYDVGFDFGVVMVGIETLPGYDSQPEPKPLWPMIYRVSPRRFFMDPQASSPQTARFMGHSWVQDKDDLLNAKGPDGQPLFNAEVVNLMQPDTSLKDAEAGVSPMLDAERVERKQLVGYEIWVRETNMVYTIATAGEGVPKDQYLRDPRPYSGCPDSGPYVLFGAYIVPDQLYPLPPLAVTAGLVEELNAHRAQAKEDAGNAKKMVFIDSQNKQAKAAILNGKSGTVWTVPGLAAGGVQEIEVGGPSKENVAYIELLKQHLDEIGGLTQTVRGNITGSTAAEAELASSSADTRTRYNKSRFREGVKQVLKAVGHFFIFNDQVTFTVMATDPMTGERAPAQFVGGMQEGQDPGAYQRLNLDIEPYSMEMVDQGILQRRIAGMSEFLGQFGPIMPQTPWVKWGNLVDDLGQANNMKDAGKRYLDLQTLDGATQAAVLMQAEGVDQQREQTAQKGQGSKPSNRPERGAPPPGGRTPQAAMV